MKDPDLIRKVSSDWYRFETIIAICSTEAEVANILLPIMNENKDLRCFNKRKEIKDSDIPHIEVILVTLNQLIEENYDE